MSIRGKWSDGILSFYESTTHETTLPTAGFYFQDDFEGPYIQTSAAGVKGWTVKDTANATQAIVANQPNGVVALSLTNANEKQEAGLYGADALNFNLDLGPIFEIRAMVYTTPTLQSEIYFGLANAYVEGPIAEADAGPTVHAFFCFDGSAVAKIFTDDASTDNDAVTTAKTCTEGTFFIFRIDCSDITDVKFYIDGERKASTSTFSMANGTNVVVQPFIMVHKETSAGLGVLYVDYVRVWQNRS